MVYEVRRFHKSCAYIVRECNEEIAEGIWTRYWREWKWGDYHQLAFTSISKSSSMLALLAFNREKPVPIGGSQVTVQAASYGENGIVNHGRLGDSLLIRKICQTVIIS